MAEPARSGGGTSAAAALSLAAGHPRVPSLNLACVESHGSSLKRVASVMIMMTMRMMMMLMMVVVAMVATMAMVLMMLATAMMKMAR